MSRKRSAQLDLESAPSTSLVATLNAVVTDSQRPRKKSRHTNQKSENNDSSRQIAKISTRLCDTLSGGHYTRCGKILRIHLTNFMCHSNLSIEFHPRVNFLVGSNGSGKSAILAALVLGLGARAKHTSRSSSIQKFIKTGEMSAKIEITFSNEGPEAFDAETYGDRITVVRTINQSVATYTIKNGHGSVISRKAEDLHRILLYHNIQVDNPAFVLNQDLAREFLKELEPAKNYQLFLKATQIELIEQKLNESLVVRQSNTIRMEQLNQKLETSRVKLAECVDKLEQLNSLQHQKNTLHELELQRFWLSVESREQELLTIRAEMQTLEDQRLEATYIVEHRNDQDVELMQSMGGIQQQLTTLNDAYRKRNEMCIDLKSRLRRSNEQCSQICTYIESYKKKLSQLQTECIDLQSSLDERSQNHTLGNVCAMRAQNEAKIEECRQHLEDNAIILATAERDRKMFLETALQKEEQIIELKRQQSMENTKLENVGLQITSIKSTSKDTLAIYGNDAMRLHAEIVKLNLEGNFSVMPKGPIGRYIQVPNPKYRDVVENQLGGLLAAYIVNNSRDRNVLQHMLRGAFPNYHLTIITTKFHEKVYDVSGEAVQPPRGTCLLMDEIRCQDTVVMNCLIDQKRIETILLVDTKDKAEYLTAHAKNVPPFLQLIIVVPAGLEYHPDPRYRMYSINIRPARFIQVAANERIVQLQDEKQQVAERIERLEQRLRLIVNELHNEKIRIGEKRLLQECHHRKQRDLEEQIDELTNMEYSRDNEIDLLKTELETVQAKLKQVNENLDEKIIELNEANKEEEHLENVIKDQQAGIKSIRQDIDDLLKKEKVVRGQMSGLENRHRLNMEKVRDLDGKLSQLQKREIIQVALVKDATEEASDYGERVATNSNNEDLLSAIQSIKAKLKHRKTITDTPENLKNLILSIELSIRVDYSDYETGQLLIKKLDKSLRNRFRHIRALKKHMAMMLHHSFAVGQYIHNVVQQCNMNAHLKNVYGPLEITPTSTMNIVCHAVDAGINFVPRDNHLEEAVSSTKALSGGERSYSTVAFLIALWSCVDHPFYFLDEYDVFTDEVNRENMTHMLIKEGRDHPNSQYTFLTPQAMRIESTAFIQIHKLLEPERR